MEKNKPYDFPDHFRDFVFMPKFDDNIETLASLAEFEDWDYKTTPMTHTKPILRSYLSYTYKKVADEKKIIITKDEEYACWNTGLVTKKQESLFIVFEKNKLNEMSQYWHFSKFYRDIDFDFNNFSSFPEMTKYFNDPTALIFDTRQELRVNIQHIIEENMDRFPAELKLMKSFSLQNTIKMSIDAAFERVKRNYKTAIPQYYQGAIQLLLPLTLLDPARADLALVVERFSDFYRGATCLTLDRAYNNARLLARPDRDWLIP